MRDMELGLSLGEYSKSKPSGFLKMKKKKKNLERESNIPNENGGALGFCMALGIGSNEPNHASNDDDVGDDDDDDDDDDQRTTSVETPVQLDLLPLVPVPRSSDDDNGSTGNMGLLAANSVGPSPFRMDFSIYRNNSGGEIVGGRNKRDFLEAGIGNDIVEAAERASSRASDDDENGLNTRKKLRLSKEQSAFLEESFKEHNTLNPKQKLALAKQLNLRPRQVEVWFQNRRARTKLKQTEVDCEYLKRCCETLTEENRRLHKELQELRALKSSNPFNMQHPATTLTMCPSCERVATTTTAPPTSTTVTAITTTSATTTITDLSAKATPFPLSRQRFFPFSPTPSHPHQSAAS